LVPTPNANGYKNDNKFGFYNHMKYRNSLHDSTKFEKKAYHIISI